MLVAVPVAGVCAAAIAYYAAYGLRDAAPPVVRPATRTMLDVRSPADALVLVRALSSDTTSTETLIMRLVGLYRTFPPREASMQALSLHQAELSGTGGIDEFAVSTLYAAMIVAVAERLHGVPALRRTRTCPLPGGAGTCVKDAA